MRIFVAGATGVLGRPTVRLLVEAGHGVRGVARGPDKAVLLRDLGAEPVSLDVLDPDALRGALEGCDAALRLTTRIPSPAKMRSQTAWAENDRLRAEGSRAIVDAALGAVVPRVVQESISFVYGDGGAAWIDEATAPAPSARNLGSALAAEAEGERFRDRGGTAVALRFGAFYGPEAESTRVQARLARRRISPMPGPAHAYVSSVHTEDAAAAVVAALEAPSGVYNVVDDEPLARAAYDKAVASALRVRKPWRPPGWVVRLAAGELAGYVTASQRVSNARMKLATSWRPRYPSVREGWAAVARAWGRSEISRA